MTASVYTIPAVRGLQCDWEDGKARAILSATKNALSQGTLGQSGWYKEFLKNSACKSKFFGKSRGLVWRTIPLAALPPAGASERPVRGGWPPNRRPGT